MKDLLLAVINSVPKKFKKGDKVSITGSDIPYVIDQINTMSYDLVYDITAEEFKKYRKIFDESFRYVDTVGGGSYREQIMSSPHSQADIDIADDVIVRGYRWIVYENELVAR
jgi:hypothetical protein